MRSSEDEAGADSEGAAPKGLEGGDSFPLKISVSGYSTSGGTGSVLLGYLIHIPLPKVYLSLLSRFLLILLNRSTWIISSSGETQIL